MDSGDRLRTVIIGRLTPGEAGGVEQATAGLVLALGQLDDGHEEYVVVTDPSAPDWLDPLLGSNTTRVVGPRTRNLKRHLGPMLPVLRRGRRLLKAAIGRPLIPTGFDPFVESLHGDVVHFPFQYFHRTTAPAIFNPHDLQHVHHPEFFDKNTRVYRTQAYRFACSWAAAVEVPSRATRQDLVTHLGVPAEKIAVIPRGAPTDLAGAAADEETVRRQYDLPATFAYFPAQTWPHKNHVRLLEALAELRHTYAVELPLVCTGRQTEHYREIEAAVRRLGLTGMVRFLGFVPPSHVRTLYRLSRMTVFPSLFEGGGFPVQEALSEGSPLICSDLPVLRESAGLAAEYCDPHSASSIARALLAVHHVPQRRDALRALGVDLAAQFSWSTAARTYRALYRALAGRHVDAQERALLASAGWQGARSNDPSRAAG